MKQLGATKRRPRPSASADPPLYFIGVESLRPFTPGSDAECPMNLGGSEVKAQCIFPNRQSFKKLMLIDLGHLATLALRGWREMGNCSSVPPRVRVRLSARVGRGRGRSQ